MKQYGYALVGLTATIAMLVGVLTFAILRVVAGARLVVPSIREEAAPEIHIKAYTAVEIAVGRDPFTTVVRLEYDGRLVRLGVQVAIRAVV